MKSAAVCAVLICMLVLIQGQARFSVSRCLCQGTLMDRIRPQRISKIEVYPPSPTCGKVEVIAVLKNGAGHKCLDPASKFAKNYIMTANKKRNALTGNSQ